MSRFFLPRGAGGTVTICRTYEAVACLASSASQASIAWGSDERTGCRYPWVGDLHQVIELIGHQRHERVTKLVCRPVGAQTGPLAQAPEVATHVSQQERRAVAGAEHEALRVVEPQHLHVLAVTLQGRHQKRVQADPPPGPLRLGAGLAHVLLADLLRPLGHLDHRLVAVDIDERPAQAG
jgi:hypothetical protein